MSEPTPHHILHDMHIGVGLRHPHYQDFLHKNYDISFLEVHPENYFCGGKNLAILDDIATTYPLSLHAVGLSLGSAAHVNRLHLERFKRLVERYNPIFISDHISWSASGNAHMNDLLPLPYTDEALEVICKNIDHVQHVMQRQFLVENPSSYVAFEHSAMDEASFINKIVERTGCGLLLDINNIFVQAWNHGNDANQYIDTINKNAVKEMHLAGHVSHHLNQTKTLLIDTHSERVRTEVWHLYEQAVSRFPHAYTLIEWDKDIPEVDVLLEEAHKAASIRKQQLHDRHAACH